MKKFAVVSIFFLSFGLPPSARADCIVGTPGCDACAAGDAACLSNAQQYTTQQQAQQPSSGGGTGFVALAPIPGLTSSEVTSVVNAESLSTFFNNLYKYAIGFAAVLAVIMIIWGGLEISTQDSVSKNRDGKEHIYNAIFGLVLVLSPALVFSIINPAILNLSLNLPELNTRSGTPVVSTSCPSGTIGTPPNCLPPCVGGRRTNCNRAAPTQEGNTATPTPGSYCYERLNPDAANDFVCASTRTICDEDYRQQVRNDGSTAYVASSCMPQ